MAIQLGLIVSLSDALTPDFKLPSSEKEEEVEEEDEAHSAAAVSPRRRRKCGITIV